MCLCGSKKEGITHRHSRTHRNTHRNILYELCAYVVQKIKPYVPYVSMWFKNKTLCDLCAYVVQKKKE